MGVDYVEELSRLLRAPSLALWWNIRGDRSRRAHRNDFFRG
jgi:hypothetical protein